MRAHKIMNPFSGNVDRAKYWKVHRKRVKAAEPTMKLNDPQNSPVKEKKAIDRRKEIRKNEEKDRIAKTNMKLAQEIFKIMDGPGMVSEILVKTYNNHPGTNNFGARLNEAKRIHYENKFLASRLDNVQPYYQFTKIQGSPKKKNIKLKKPSHNSKRTNQYKSSSKSTGGSAPSSPRSIRTAPHPNRREHYSDDRKPPSSAGGKRDGAKPKNLIMEHWKIQNGRVLDVAVLKEPFEDRFSLLGIDVDDGQRYQLSLSSEEVSNILEGDMLVTSFDNPNVWLALIEKVNLRPVMAFVKPGSAPMAVTASISLATDPKPMDASVVSSLSGHQGELAEESIATQEEDKGSVTLAEDWGSLNMPAIDVPIRSYGADPEYDDAFEDADEGPEKTGADAESHLPIINSITGNDDDSTGVEAAPPPFELPSTRPSRPVTAGNRGSSTSVGDAPETRGRKDSGRPVPAPDSVPERAQEKPGDGDDDGMGVKTFSVSTTGNSNVSRGTDISVDMSDGESARGRPTPPPGSKPSSKRNTIRNSNVSPRPPKNDKKPTPPIENVPWNSNVLVTKVRERMAEISAVEQEIAVKKRATEIKQKKTELQNKPGNKTEEENEEDENSPQKVSFKPEPPSGPKPSAPQGEQGSFRSVRGRRPTAFPPKDGLPADEQPGADEELENEAPEASVH